MAAVRLHPRRPSRKQRWQWHQLPDLQRCRHQRRQSSSRGIRQVQRIRRRRARRSSPRMHRACAAHKRAPLAPVFDLSVPTVLAASFVAAECARCRRRRRPCCRRQRQRRWLGGAAAGPPGALRRRVRLAQQRKVLGAHAGAVVLDAHAELVEAQAHADGRGARVERVENELLGARREARDARARADGRGRRRVERRNAARDHRGKPGASRGGPVRAGGPSSSVIRIVDPRAAHQALARGLARRLRRDVCYEEER